MRKLITLLFITVFLSCGKNKEEIIKENISSKIKVGFKNPDSFEFVSMNLKKTIYIKERLTTSNKDSLAALKIRFEGYEPAKEIIERTQKEIDFIEKEKDPNKPIIYRYDFVCKGTNSFGGIIQGKYTVDVLNDDQYTVLSYNKND